MTQILKTSRLARWIVGVLAGSLAMLPAFAAEPNVVVNKVRPIDSATNDVIYAPVVGFNGNFNTPPTSRLNMA